MFTGSFAFHSSDYASLIQTTIGPGYEFAKQEKCPLLTGDKALRSAAAKEGVLVQGTIWIVEQLIHQEIISIDQAREAYEKMKQAGSRLPWSMIKDRLTEIEVG